MEKTTDDIKHIKEIMEKYIENFKSIPRTPETFESKDFHLLVHKKEVFNRILQILETSNLE
jgi:hypothetical protein